MTANLRDPARPRISEPLLSGCDGAVSVELAELFRDKIGPVLLRFFAGKLHSSMRHTDVSHRNQDALELVGEAKLKILNKLVGSGSATQIVDIDAYTRVVARNVFNQYLRVKHPKRLSVKNQCRYLLKRHRELEVWKDADDVPICALSGIDRQETPVQPLDLNPEDLSELRARLANNQSSGNAARMVDAVFAILRHVGRPLAIEDLVTGVMELLVIDEPIETTDPDVLSALPGISVSPISILGDREFATRLWEEILTLPVRHRAALLLNFRDDGGEDLCATIAATAAVSIGEMAAALEIAPDRFAEIWKELPWDDNRIAAFLEIERQQVINLRQSAKQKLRRMLSR